MDRLIQKNGLIKKELLLLKPFIKEPWKEFTLSDIKKSTGTKSHHYVFESLKRFTSMGILDERKVGKTNVYRINTKSVLAIAYLSFLESIIRDGRKDIPYRNILEITNKIKSPYYTLLVGGSYAGKKQTPKSDLDVAIIIPNSEDKRTFEIALREGEFVLPEIHGYVFTQEEFYLMLIDKKELNYGKELARKHIIFFGGEPYYRILLEAIENGFKG